MSYRIVRMYREDNKASKIIDTGLTLEEAKAHCKREDTHAYDSDGHVVWFDGFEEE